MNELSRKCIDACNHSCEYQNGCEMGTSRSKFEGVRFAMSACAVLITLATLGCDDPSSRPPPPQPTATTPPEDPNAPPLPPKPPRPTTQELLNGPRTPISLKAIPFIVDAPKGWAVDS